MKAFGILTGIAVFFCHCNYPDNPKKTEKGQAVRSATPGPSTKDPDQLSGCYGAAIGKDSAQLQLDLNGNTVSGYLRYNRFEKDDSKGSFTGIIENNTIKTWFTFQSEGTVSVKQLFFKIDHNKLEEGYGEMDLKHDTAIFRYPTALRYEENHPYLKVNCN